MITTIRIAFIFCLTVVLVSSCNSGNSLSTFNTRKYTPGYFANFPVSKPEIYGSTSMQTVKKTSIPAKIEKAKVVSVASNENTVTSNQRTVLVSSALINKSIFVKEAIIPPAYRSIGSVKDTVDQGLKDQRHKRLGEVGLFVLSAGLLVIAFTFIATSGLLYALFVLLSIGVTIITFLIDESMPRSIIMRGILILLAALDFIGFGFILLEGHQD